MATIPSEVRGGPSFARILVATEGSPFGDRAVEWAREIALLDPGKSRVFVVHAIPPAGGHDRDVLDVAMRALGSGTRAESVLAYGEPALAIARLAADVRADLVIVGSHGGNVLDRALLGSVSDRVKDDVTATVLIARTPPPPRRILLADDGSTTTARAGVIASWWTRGWRVPLSIYRASRRSPAGVGALVTAHARGVGAELVVVGSHPRGRLGRLIAGSVGAHLAHHSAASVLIVKD